MSKIDIKISTIIFIIVLFNCCIIIKLIPLGYDCNNQYFSCKFYLQKRFGKPAVV